ncbi:MAG: FecR family protein [Chloroflexota bacterium]
MKQRLWIAGGLVLVVVVIIVILLFSLREQERTATVIEAVNEVDAHPRPKDNWLPAVVDMTIYGGGQVRAGTESSARLELLEGTVCLSADSIFTVKKSVTRRGTLLTTLFLEEGRLWVHLTSDWPHEFTVETGSAVATVRDTRFSVKVADGETLVSVAEGEVELTAQEQSVTVAAAEQATVEPGQPPSPPEPLSDEERRMWATEGEIPELAPPIGQVDAEMDGKLAIRGVVKDSLGAVAPDVYMTLTAYRERVDGPTEWLWDESVFTDETGEYAFNNLSRVKGGQYQIWLYSPQEYDQVYEDSGYYINENEIIGDTYVLNIMVHPVTGSAFSGVIRYQDANGTTKNLLSNPPGTDLFIELNRVTDNNTEYTVGSGYDIDDGNTVYFGGLAGGTYYLIIQYTKPDGVRIGCVSPFFEISPGETKQFDYIIPADSWDSGQ